jgi:hypothetical protein
MKLRKLFLSPRERVRVRGNQPFERQAMLHTQTTPQ